MNIKELRKALNLNQKDFASELGISQSFLSEIEKGRKTPSETLLIAMRYKFNLSDKWLSNGTGEIFKKNYETFSDSNITILLDIMEIIDMALGSKIKPEDKRKLVEYVFNAWLEFKSNSQQDNEDVVNIKDFVKHNIPLALKLIRTA